MNKVTLFATASLLFAGVTAANAQSSDPTANNAITFAVRSMSNGITYNVTSNGDASSVVASKSDAGLLRVRANVTFDPSVVLFTMEGPYGTNSSFVTQLGTFSASFGQYLNTPLCLQGVQTYTVKFYNFLGVVSTKTLTVNLDK